MEISRSEQKRRLKRLEELAAELAGLSAAEIGRIPCSAEVRKLLREAAAMKGGARKRQLKYITRLLGEEPLDPIYAFVSGKKGAALREKKEFHEMERYRDAILNEAIAAYRDAGESPEAVGEEWAGPVIEEVRDVLPGIDGKAAARLASLYARTRNRRYSRELFRLLRAAHELKKRNPVSGGGETER
ncbi:MAG TPA: DUF615 domain-containing protein [Desulfobacteraceae bacterium]|nr:DUF615 domain-containing protein [Desulfobacteraceae bacterium]